MKDCEYFLRGRNFVLKTDHKPLTWLDKKVYRNAKVARWAEYLSGYNFVIQYLPGVDNSLADMFSRQSRENYQICDQGKEAGHFEDFGCFKIYVPSGASKNDK